MLALRVRATVNAFVANITQKVSDRWPRYFWIEVFKSNRQHPITRERSKLELQLQTR